ncbi:MAG: alpha/beta hydrolase, partial [Actinobacteria bacterium]|nr:alpha/beta hydrolase [Actinomycetota bacterium]
MWRPQVEDLTQYHLLVPDLPEHGKSISDAPFTIDHAAAEVAELIRTRAHGGRATVVGLSEGAQITVALLALAPAIVERAIVSSALVRPTRGAWMVTPSLVAWSFRLGVTPFKKSEWWMRANMKGAAGVPDMFVDDFRRTFRETTEQSFVHVIIENQRFRLPAHLEPVTAPVLAVCGHGEYEVMRRSTVDIAAAIPGAKAYEVVHPGRPSVAQQHNWNMHLPVIFTEMVRAWMTGSPLPEAL